MSRAPALFLFVALSAALFCFERISPFAFPLFACLVLVGLCLIFKTDSKGEISVVITLAVMTFFCAVWIAFFVSKPSAENMKFESIGVVADIRLVSRQQALLLTTQNGGFVVKRPLQERYRLGETLRISGWTKKFSQKADSSFREDFFWKARGADAQIVATRIERVEQKNFSLYSWRQKLHDYFENLPDALGGYLDAMWTGIRDDELRRQHSRWGTVHLLAISGFHVGLVVWLAGMVFFFVPSRRLRAVLMSSILWLYILVAGAPPSAMRAGLMFQMGLICGLIGRPVIGLNCVAVAAVALLTYSPFLFWDVGFRLSVVAAMTITALSATTTRKNLYLAITPAVYITTYPIIAPIFGGVPLAGLVINFFAIPFFAFAFPLASFAALFTMFVYPADFILRAFGRFADFIASFVPFNVEWNSYLAASCTMFFVVMIFMALRNERKT